MNFTSLMGDHLCVQASDENCVSSGGTWHNSTVEPGWIWKGDTSSDEICGHIAGYLLFHELVAESAEERQQSASVLVDIVRNIQDHGYYLIGAFHSFFPPSPLCSSRD